MAKKFEYEAEDREQLIDHLVGNCVCESEALFNEDQRDMLEAMSDDRLSRFDDRPAANAEDDNEDLEESSEFDDDYEETPVINRKRPVPANARKKKPAPKPDPEEELEDEEDENMATNEAAEVEEMSEEAWLATAPPAIRELIANGRMKQEAHKDQLIASIVANSDNMFEADELSGKSIDELTKLSALAERKAPVVNEAQPVRRGNYVGQATPVVNKGHKESPLLPPVMDFSLASED